MARLKISSAVGPVLRSSFGLLVGLALLSACLHYTQSRWSSKDVASEGIPELTALDDYHYKTNVTYKPFWGIKQYDADEWERKVNLRVSVIGLGKGTTLLTQQAEADYHPEDNFIDVIADLSYYLWIGFVWFAVLIGIAMVRAVVEMFDLVQSVDEDGVPLDKSDNSGAQRGIRAVYNFVCAFESHEATVQFLRSVGLGNPTNILQTTLALMIRSLMSLFREGFFIVVATVGVTYAYVTLAAYEGSCIDEFDHQQMNLTSGDVDATEHHFKNCNVQQVPIQRLSVVLVVLLAIASRLASAYNYSDGNWDMATRSVVKKLREEEGIELSELPSLLGDALSASTWNRILGVAKNHVGSATVQGFACMTTVSTSVLLMIVLGYSWMAIGDERQFLVQAVWGTFLTLEILFVVLNLMVYLLSTTTWISTLRNLKVYIEGKLYAALYISAIALAIYMSLRRAVNMFGGGEETPHDHHRPELDHPSYFQPKQLGPADDVCHYIPRRVFDHHDDYGWQPCTGNFTQRGCCALTEFDSDDATNGVTVYTGLIVALVGLALQVLIAAVTACFYEDSAVSTAVDDVTGRVQLPRLPRVGVQRDFKTITVV